MTPRRTRNRARLFSKALATASLGLVLACFLTESECAGAAESPAPTRGPERIPTKDQARQMEQVLWRRVLDAWYPRCLDMEKGGFHEDFAEDWSREPTGSKFVVFQARMTWTAATVAMHYPEHRRRFLSYARHGLKFLADRQWDETCGGFFERVDEAGEPDPQWLPWKQLYGQAFGIYGAAAAYEATGDREALDLAVKAFRWIDAHAHDDQHGGYFELVTREGVPVALLPPEKRGDVNFPVIGRIGHKSMNAHIHTLEALTALERVWKDPVLKTRLDEVFLLVRDKIVRPEGHLAMFPTRDWQPFDERSSFGHELETAFLLIEAEEALGRHDQRTRQVARRLVDHSLRFGWDEVHGGFFDEGPPADYPEKRIKVWWAQPEATNGLLTVHRLFGQEDPRYAEIYGRSWAFFRDHFIDPKHGGSFEVVDETGQPLAGRRNKATRWKAAYHVVRGLLVGIEAAGVQ
jgi:mannobiose 2-epimerase